MINSGLLVLIAVISMFLSPFANSFQTIRALWPADLVVLQDDFENVQNDTYPSQNGWWNEYAGYSAKVTTAYSFDGSKSFQLSGKGDFARDDVHNLNAYDYITFEVAMRLNTTAGSAAVGLHNPNIGQWGTSYAYVLFDKTGVISADGSVLQTYSSNQWYKVKVEANFVTQKMNVYIDDVLKAQGLSTGLKNWNSLVLCAGNCTSPGSADTIAYFDAISVTRLDNPPAGTEATPPPSPPPGAQFILHDDLENVQSNIYPSQNGWWNEYSGYSANVTTELAYDGRKSFRLSGKGDFARDDVHNLNAYDYITFEVAMRLNTTAGSAAVGLHNPNIGQWGTSYAYVLFDKTGVISADGSVLQTYSSNQWYKVKVEANFVTQKMNVYIDDVLKAQGLSTGLKNWNSLVLCAGNCTSPGSADTIAYFDAISVTSLFCAPGIVCDKHVYLPMIKR